MAVELKKKILKRDQAATTEPEEVPKGGKGARGDGQKAVSPKADPHSKLEKKSDGTSPAGEYSGEDGLSETRSRWKRIFGRKALFFAVPAIVLMLSAGLLLIKYGSRKPFLGTPQQKLEPVVGIKRPLPIPDYREMLDFIILNETDRQKTMVALRMEFAFHSPTAYQNFKDQNVIFRDTVYSFLLRQNALRNTHNSWHTVVEKDLLDYLRVKLPQGKADQIRLTQVENL